MADEEPDLATIADIASMLGVSRVTALQHLQRRGINPHSTVSGKPGKPVSMYDRAAVTRAFSTLPSGESITPESIEDYERSQKKRKGSLKRPHANLARAKAVTYGQTESSKKKIEEINYQESEAKRLADEINRARESGVEINSEPRTRWGSTRSGGYRGRVTMPREEYESMMTVGRRLRDAAQFAKFRVERDPEDNQGSLF